MNDTYKKENTLIELEKISDLLAEIQSVDSEIEHHKNDKINLIVEVDEAKEELEEYIDSERKAILRDYKEERFNMLPRWAGFKDLGEFPLSPPSHWNGAKDPQKMEKGLEEEKLIEFFSTPEMKEKIYNAFLEYDKHCLAFMDACKKKCEEIEECSESFLIENGSETFKSLIEKIQENNRRIKENENLVQELTKKKEDLEKQLPSFNVISQDLLYLAPKILKILKQKRADDLKQAINLALDEERKEEEMAILERQALDNRLHNMAMERAAEKDALERKAHNAAMEKAAQEQAAALRDQTIAAQKAAEQAEIQTKIAKDQAKSAQSQTGQASNTTSKRCFGCANRYTCAIRHSDSAHGCPAFRPQ